jgi:hypothetical protein
MKEERSQRKVKRMPPKEKDHLSPPQRKSEVEQLLAHQ